MSILTIVFWDVQHGNAAYLNTPNGKNFAIDLGIGSFDNSNITFSPLDYIRNSLNVSSLDGVIITHPHTDHIDDILNFDMLSPGVLIRPKHLTEEEIRNGNPPGDRAKIDKYLEVNTRYNVTLSSGSSPFDSANNGGVTFQTFISTGNARSNLNNHSIVTVVTYAGVKVLIPGDNESPSWNELLGDPSFVTAIKGTNLLLAPHHGREAGFSEKLFEHFTPYLTVVSDGSVCDTSARDRYRTRSKGWTVYDKEGEQDTRYCLTTGSDGTITVQIGVSPEAQRFMYVRTSR